MQPQRPHQFTHREPRKRPKPLFIRLMPLIVGGLALALCGILYLGRDNGGTTADVSISENPVDTVPGNTATATLPPTAKPTATATPFYELTEIADEKLISQNRATALVAESQALALLAQVGIDADKQILGITMTAEAIENRIAERTPTATPLPPTATPNVRVTEIYLDYLEKDIEQKAVEIEQADDWKSFFIIFGGLALVAIFAGVIAGNMAWKRKVDLERTPEKIEPEDYEPQAPQTPQHPDIDEQQFNRAVFLYRKRNLSTRAICEDFQVFKYSNGRVQDVIDSVIEYIDTTPPQEASYGGFCSATL